MRRREFLGALGAAAVAWTPATHAQPSQAKRIGALILGNADAPLFLKALNEGLRDLGRVEGRDYVIDLRSAEGQLGRLPELAADLVRLKVDVIVALFTPCALAAQKATRDIPIVIVSGDPLGTGLVKSLSRPGANITGLSAMGAETHAKCVELFRDMLPSARRVAIIVNADDPIFAKSLLEQVPRAGSGTGLEVVAVTIHGSDELEAGFGRVIRQKADAAVYQASLATKRVAELAITYQLPTATIIRAFAEVGGLMAYGSDEPELFRRAATFVHRIFQGEKPADIPVEQPTKFNLVVNLKTARAIGVTVPPTMIARADEVIE